MSLQVYKVLTQDEGCCNFCDKRTKYVLTVSSTWLSVRFCKSCWLRVKNYKGKLS